MIRSINEIKAWKGIYIWFPINILAIGLYGYYTSTSNIILASLTVGFYLFSLIMLCKRWYDLGWEYKRISINGYTLEVKTK